MTNLDTFLSYIFRSSLLILFDFTFSPFSVFHFNGITSFPVWGVGGVAVNCGSRMHIPILFLSCLVKILLIVNLFGIVEVPCSVRCRLGTSCGSWDSSAPWRRSRASRWPASGCGRRRRWPDWSRSTMSIRRGITLTGLIYRGGKVKRGCVLCRISKSCFDQVKGFAFCRGFDMEWRKGGGGKAY